MVLKQLFDTDISLIMFESSYSYVFTDEELKIAGMLAEWFNALALKARVGIFINPEFESLTY